MCVRFMDWLIDCTTTSLSCSLDRSVLKNGWVVASVCFEFFKPYRVESYFLSCFVRMGLTLSLFLKKKKEVYV